MLALFLFKPFETLIPQRHNFFATLRRNIRLSPICSTNDGGVYEFFRFL
jgi:hypothetical protein